uniref:Phosphomevalonate kinase n=2 Tax=Meloidogyne TaxID=189290 RepID=A0A914MFB2_MELIC
MLFLSLSLHFLIKILILDYITNQLVNLINKHFPSIIISICTLSEPLKKEYAKINNLNFNDLMTDGKAKELVRKEMIEFGEKLRKEDFGIFCRKAFIERKIQNLPSLPTTNPSTTNKFKEIILISDCRRPTDFEFFKNNFKNSSIICVRINSKIEIRQKRGFLFIEGIDNEESECALDEFKNWDFNLFNNEEEKEGGKGEGEVEKELKNIINYLKQLFN